MLLLQYETYQQQLSMTAVPLKLVYPESSPSWEEVSMATLPED